MTWTSGWRTEAWSQLNQPWDVLIIGGGITGAGILRLAAQAGLRCLLVEAHDFAAGTSSRSSKLVHGGLRYLKNAQLKLTLESVQERELILRQGRGLVNRLGFLYASQKNDKMPGFIFGLGLAAYDIMARQWTHRAYDLLDLRELCPPLSAPGLQGGYRYFDAQTDDARLVLRLLREAVADSNGNALALNYTRAERLLRSANGQVCGAALVDASGESARCAEVQARVVINATGAWADGMRSQVGRKKRLRPLRGSHLVFSSARLPLTRAVSFLHPRDGRPVFAVPWEGVVIFGTTDVDHGPDLQIDPAISAAEFDYLLSSLQSVFPAQELQAQDVIATFAGLRPVVDTGKADPSKESREHAIWEEDGLLTVSGGKLTTFRLMARDALNAVRQRLARSHFAPHSTLLNPFTAQAEALLSEQAYLPAQRLRLLGRYGTEAAGSFSTASLAERQLIPGTPYCWAELRQAARAEGVLHLDDLLLRRVRLGVLLPGGGAHLLEQIRQVTQTELGWDDSRWAQESAAYIKLWQAAYAPR